MLARLQQGIVIVLLAAAAAWAAFFIAAGRPGFGLGAAALILFGYALFLAVEFAILAAVQEPLPAAPRASASQLLRAWLGEVITAPQVFCWRQPFRSQAIPDLGSATDATGRCGVVLVHGFVCNRGLWNPWLRKLRARGVPCIAVNLEPVFDAIDHYPPIIEEAVARLEAATARPVVLVGHSMGGLAIRAWLRQYNADARVHHVVTIGTPHHGTWLARFGHTLNGQQMRQRGPWLTQLAADEPLERATRFTCFYGHCDNIVFPSATATLSGAINMHLPATAHVQMAFHPAVFDEVCRRLDISAAG